MNIDSSLLFRLLLSLGAAFVISFALTPAVKAFAQKVGAMDVPTEARRVWAVWPYFWAFCSACSSLRILTARSVVS